MREPLTVERLLELRYVSDPTLSPDGMHAAAVVTRIEEGDPPAYRSRVHLWNLRAGDETPFTQGTARDTNPRFSPDGRTLAFLSDRTGDTSQIFVIPTFGGEARGLTSFKAGVSEFVWHPDGVHLALLSRADEEQDDGLGRRVTRTYYKQDGVGFRPEGVAQIFLLNTRTGEVNQVTHLGTNPGGLAFGADGPLYFAAAHTVEDEGYYYRNVWRMDLETGELRALIDQPNPLLASSPSGSPDGTRVAYLAPCIPERISSPTGLWTVSSAGGSPTLLTGELDCAPLVGGDSRYGNNPNAPQWSEDGKHIFVNGNERGSSYVVKVSIETKEREVLQPAGRAVTSFVRGKGRLLFTAETPERPGELYALEPDGTERRLSGVNDAFAETYTLGKPSEEVRLPTTDREAEIVYWTLAPETPREDGAMVVQVHGGPRTNYGYGFLFEFQLLAAKGYTVVYGNPRGGSSYGYGFSDSISGRLGTIDADDVLSIARDARAKHMKPNAPVHLTGGSYGGFMTNWLVTQTDEFTSAVTQRSITNWLSFYGTSDIGFSWIHIETGGNPWEHTEKLWDQSPIKHVANVSTPLLILHAEDDHRCPIEQAEQFFTALRVLGRAVEFVRFPGEGHELSRAGRPDRRIQRLTLILEWFESHPQRRHG